MSNRKNVEPNYWLRRVRDDADAAKRAARGERIENTLYAIALVILWIVATLVITWKTLPGGVGMVPTFLILEGLYTALTITAWVKGK